MKNLRTCVQNQLKSIAQDHMNLVPITCWYKTNICVVTSYVLLQLIFQPGKVKLQVRAIHQFLAPAGNLCNYPWCHVHNESIRAIQEIQERTPHWFSLLWRMLSENFYTWVVLLKRDENIFNFILTQKLTNCRCFCANLMPCIFYALQ